MSRPGSAQTPTRRAVADRPALVIRRACFADRRALAHLAELDEAPVPAEPLLVGEVGGRLWVAVSLVTLDAVADPFKPSAEITQLVCARARQLRGEVEARPSARPGWAKRRDRRRLRGSITRRPLTHRGR